LSHGGPRARIARHHRRNARRRGVRPGWPLAGGRGPFLALLRTRRRSVRRLSALARPGAWVIVTTPNQLSALSLLSLLASRRFVAFQDALFPAHRTSLLESDLCRAARECGLEIVAVAYTLRGRL